MLFILKIFECTHHAAPNNLIQRYLILYIIAGASVWYGMVGFRISPDSIQTDTFFAREASALSIYHWQAFLPFEFLLASS